MTFRAWNWLRKVTRTQRNIRSAVHIFLRAMPKVTVRTKPPKAIFLVLSVTWKRYGLTYREKRTAWTNAPIGAVIRPPRALTTKIKSIPCSLPLIKRFWKNTVIPCNGLRRNGGNIKPVPLSLLTTKEFITSYSNGTV